MAFTYADGWWTTGSGLSKREARKAAKYMQTALLGDSGRDAISQMAQGYARAMAMVWRRAADSDDYAEDAAALHQRAARSEQLGALAGRY
jgi:hypothetical protein